MTGIEAASELESVQRLFDRLPETGNLYEEWARLVKLHDVRGKNAHDARLVAATNLHGVKRILTFNKQDFARFPGIEVVSP
jgi:predicted nucleic acid-binding protein